MKETFMMLLPYIGIALIGSVANIVRELARLENISKNFSFRVWWDKNRFKSFYSLLTTVATVFLLHESGELGIASAVMAGFIGDAMIKTKVSKTNLLGSTPTPTDDGTGE